MSFKHMRMHSTADISSRILPSHVNGYVLGTLNCNDSVLSEPSENPTPIEEARLCTPVVFADQVYREIELLISFS